METGQKPHLTSPRRDRGYVHGVLYISNQMRKGPPLWMPCSFTLCRFCVLILDLYHSVTLTDSDAMRWENGQMWECNNNYLLMHAYILGIIKEKSNEKVSSRDWTQLIMIAQQPTYFEIYLKCYQKFLNIKIFDLYIFFYMGTWMCITPCPLLPLLCMDIYWDRCIKE